MVTAGNFVKFCITSSDASSQNKKEMPENIMVEWSVLWQKCVYPWTSEFKDKQN
jgi:hypothetical protein